MQLLSYKTNISDERALNKVTTVLNNLVGSPNWQLDVSDRYKVLTVFSHDLINEKLLLKSLRKLGVKATSLEGTFERRL